MDGLGVGCHRGKGNDVKRALCAVAVATVATVALPLPAAQADQLCDGIDELSYINPPQDGEKLRQPLLKYDKDGDRYICVGTQTRKNGATRLVYYDDL